MSDLVLVNDGAYQSMMETGLRLASLPESEGGWAEYFDEDAGLGIKDDFTRACTAILLENNKRWQAKLCRGRIVEGRIVVNEAVRSALLGGYTDYLLPMVRAAFPTNAINDLVAVQPTLKRVATCMYWNYSYGTTKGSISAGQRIFDATSGVQFPASQTNQFPRHYSGEYVDGETTGTVSSSGTNTNDVMSGTLAWVGGGVRPGSVRLTWAGTGTVTITAVDNGNGSFVVYKDAATNAVSSSSINYATGAFSIVGGTNGVTAAGTSTTATAYYRFNSEGTRMPRIDITLTTSTVETERRALELNYPIEAAQDVSAEWGQPLEPQLLAAGAELLNLEVAAQIIAEMWAVAPTFGSFDTTIPDGISLEQHFRSIMYLLNGASSDIWDRTQKGYGSWIIVDTLAGNVIKSLPRDLFEKAPTPASVNGLHFIGILGGQFRVYLYKGLRHEPGASALGNILMGWKGSGIQDAGLVYMPYQVFYTTDTLTDASFTSQKGLATRYATKLVNPNFYAKITLTST